MSKLAIKVENISKLYRLGQVGTGTLQQDIKRWWWNTTGKGDPFAKVGEVNDRTSKGSSDYVWALKDINFEVEKGEVIGIIGRNGAGKSTLLKILSKTTSPTSGSIKINGRIASLLEVGTGFHPELTGRENIYLNGAILGMTKREIRSKFDEIVDFSGVERYIDTPVKRYSSGMYVRLAFAVAAHLEPEILIVDEVLAVGDAEFQKKCLGKMKDVSVNDGRTVLFVSHNMTAIRNLCNKGAYFKNGCIDFIGEIEDCVDRYLLSDNEIINTLSYTNQESNSYIKKIAIESTKLNFYSGGDIIIKLNVDLKGFEFLNIDLGIYNKEEELMTIISSKYNDSVIIDNSENIITCVVPKNPLLEGVYYVNAFLTNDKGVKVEYLERCLQFEVINGDFYGNNLLPNIAVRSKFLIDYFWR